MMCIKISALSITMDDVDYKMKYIKYKVKYLQLLEEMEGGRCYKGSSKINEKFGVKACKNQSINFIKINHAEIVRGFDKEIKSIKYAFENKEIDKNFQDIFKIFNSIRNYEKFEKKLSIDEEIYGSGKKHYQKKQELKKTVIELSNKMNINATVYAVLQKRNSHEYIEYKGKLEEILKKIHVKVNFGDNVINFYEAFEIVNDWNPNPKR